MSSLQTLTRAWTLMPVMDLWVRQPYVFLNESLQEGFRNFTWSITMAMAKRLDPIGRLRVGALGYGQSTKLMLIDYAGATEYGLFSRYDEPVAVYPTWTYDDGFNQLRWLCANPVSEISKFTNSKIRVEHRPVKGQKHRVVVWGFSARKAGMADLHEIMTRVYDLEAEFDVEIFMSGLTSYDHLFQWNLKAADYRPQCLVDNKIHMRVVLPSGKVLNEEAVIDGRYSDWFDLLGITQSEVMESLATDRLEIVRYNLRSAQWARRNYTISRSFVLDRQTKLPRDIELEPTTRFAASSEFVLPATRRNLMRNIGFKPTELDKFICDACILHNTCTQYRAGSVCTLKGSEGVALADSFGTRSAERIIDGLDALLKRQAERLEDAMVAEDPADPNPDITRQLNAVFANGVKLAKLLDPSLNGGPKVQVNVGVGAGGHAAISTSQADPRQITAQVVRELEASGIPREQITGEMLAGYFKSMGVAQDDPELQAVAAVKAIAAPKKKAAKVLPEDYDPEEALISRPLIEPINLNEPIEGEVV